MTAIADIHWRACETCKHLLRAPADGEPLTILTICEIDMSELKQGFIIDSPELRCGCYEDEVKSDE